MPCSCAKECRLVSGKKGVGKGGIATENNSSFIVMCSNKKLHSVGRAYPKLTKAIARRFVSFYRQCL